MRSQAGGVSVIFGRVTPAGVCQSGLSLCRGSLASSSVSLKMPQGKVQFSVNWLHNLLSCLLLAFLYFKSLNLGHVLTVKERKSVEVWLKSWELTRLGWLTNVPSDLLDLSALTEKCAQVDCVLNLRFIQHSFTFHPEKLLDYIDELFCR